MPARRGCDQMQANRLPRSQENGAADRSRLRQLASRARGEGDGRPAVETMQAVAFCSRLADWSGEKISGQRSKWGEGLRLTDRQRRKLLASFAVAGSESGFRSGWRAVTILTRQPPRPAGRASRGRFVCRRRRSAELQAPPGAPPPRRRLGARKRQRVCVGGQNDGAESGFDHETTARGQ